jgi:hypothetical protein
MSSARRTFLWMGALSVVTLLLGAIRELVIARDLQASGAADLFFRGLVVVGSARAVGLSLFRARFIPVGSGTTTLALLREELRTCALIVVVAISALGVMLTPAEWGEPTAWVFVVAIVLAVIGGAIRALAERAGFERRGFVLEWSLPLGSIAGAILLSRGALGPTVGITVGLLVGVVALLPVMFDRAREIGTPDAATPRRPQTRWLLLDTLIYVNLGWVEGGLSQYVFAAGGFALLNYASLFINAALAVPSAAATVVALRIAGWGDVAAHRRVRGWALLAAAIVAGAVLAVWAALSWAPVAALVDRAAGWSLASAIAPIVLCSVPFAALRLANTVGRQRIVAHEPRTLIVYDVVGLIARALVLVFGVAYWGLLASPIGLAVAEIIQLTAWVRAPVPSRRRALT